jgi:hypothetical protein
MKNHAMRRAGLSSLAVAVFTMVLGAAGQTPLQAAMCNCNVPTDCRGTATCRMGSGCLSPGQFIGLCWSGSGSVGKLEPKDFTSESRPGEATKKKRHQLQQP